MERRDEGGRRRGENGGGEGREGRGGMGDAIGEQKGEGRKMESRGGRRRREGREGEQKGVEKKKVVIEASKHISTCSMSNWQKLGIGVHIHRYTHYSTLTDTATTQSCSSQTTHEHLPRSLWERVLLAEAMTSSTRLRELSTLTLHSSRGLLIRSWSMSLGERVCREPGYSSTVTWKLAVILGRYTYKIM